MFELRLWCKPPPNGCLHCFPYFYFLPVGNCLRRHQTFICGPRKRFFSLSPLVIKRRKTNTFFSWKHFLLIVWVCLYLFFVTIQNASRGLAAEAFFSSSGLIFRATKVSRVAKESPDDPEYSINFWRRSAHTCLCAGAFRWRPFHSKISFF